MSSLDTTLDYFRNPISGSDTNPAIRWVDWVLRGNGQVVFQSNWLSGILILVAIAVNSPVYLVAAVLGTVVSTATAVALKLDRGLIDAGLLGFNGCLAGIGINFYMSQDITNGDWPNWAVYVLMVLAAGFSTIIFGALSSLLGSRLVPTLTAPFVFASWAILFSVYSFFETAPGSLLTSRLPVGVEAASEYTFSTFLNGTFKGVGEIFFQDNAWTGLIMVIAVLVNTRIGGLMCVGGPALAALIAMAFGANEGTIAAGLFGFNASLTAIALGGMFFVANKAGYLYALFGVIITVFMWPAFATLLAPMGMPTFTFPFVITTWMFMLAKPSMLAVTPVAPPEATYPEENIRQSRAGALGPGR